MKTLLVDNYDSYTHILAHYLWRVNGEKPLVLRNDALTLEDVRGLEFDNIVVSPGPGHPARSEDFGICPQLFAAFPDKPILGVCLGHQGLAHFAGARVRRAPKAMHGKVSTIQTDGGGLFRGMPRRFRAVRYHSLAVDGRGAGGRLEIIARSLEDGQVMGLKIKDRPWYGVQFHPESVDTEQGLRLIANFGRITRAWQRRSRALKSGGLRFFSRILDGRDAETLFLRLYAREPYAFWLDSSRPGADARFSYLGAPRRVVETRADRILVKTVRPGGKFRVRECRQGNPFEFYGRLFSQPAPAGSRRLPFAFKGGWVGFLGYELKEFLGYAPRRTAPGAVPDSLMMEADRFLAFDHREKKIYACMAAARRTDFERWFRILSRRLENAPPAGRLEWTRSPRPARVPRLKVRPALSKGRYLKRIKEILGKIRAGETYETCLTDEFRVRARLDPLDLYRVLRLTNPAPYAAYLRFPGAAALSSSPELFLQCGEDGRVLSEPIKGTRLKGATPAATRRITRELERSGKDRSELLMITDLIRNDLAKVCAPGSVRVSRRSLLREHATVLQLSSRIEGRLAPGRDAWDLLRAAFPGGSVTGAPKHRTLRLLRGWEGRDRGLYTGCIGYFSRGGALALNIAIRTLVAERGLLRFGAGGAIVAESSPAREYREILVKAYPMLRAVYLAKYGKFGYDAIIQRAAGGAADPRAAAAARPFKVEPDLPALFD